MRLDKFIAQKGLVQSRSRAEQLISDGSVKVNGKTVTKPAFSVEENDKIEISDSINYVGRGGLKLEYAINKFNISVNGADAIDIGASTGGFTECLLNFGAKSICAVDVGHGQMAEKLKADPRVTLLENTNARFITPEIIGGRKDLAVMDVSFISQTAIFSALFECVNDSADIVTLVKPQFEAGSEFLSKKGIIKDRRIYKSVLEKIDLSTNEFGYGIKNACVSPIKGGDGNTEFLVHIKKDVQKTFNFDLILQKE